jgi:hypothetical protein
LETDGDAGVGVDEDEADEDETDDEAENDAAGELGEERADPRSGLFSAIVALSAR